MRSGSNPQKKTKKLHLTIQHRVVVVTYIPKLQGYYANSLEVLKMCLDSLIKANDNTYKITVVNNGSCKAVFELLHSYAHQDIDTIIHHRTNIGKIDAVIGAARGSREDYITLSDSDILFTIGWNRATMQVFKAFKNVGSVSPIPFRHGLYYGTSSTLGKILFRKVKYYYKPIPENYEEHNKYLTSINWNNEKDNNINWPFIESNSVKAIVGSGHQVLTLKRGILFETVPFNPSLTLVGGDSEYRYIDEPIDKAGLMRLGTYNNYAYHMGNEVEEWMYEKLENEIGLNADYNYGDSLFNFRKTNENDSKVYKLKKYLLKKAFKIFYR
ncbi:glycosyltransferase family A protein [Zunongwangia sp. H14]|uniref:glycosyltransferase family A protein n=1 Tax=Zunongwangia sp. H14 TaxID=3240792 RepID=UPI003568E4C6